MTFSDVGGPRPSNFTNENTGQFYEIILPMRE